MSFPLGYSPQRFPNMLAAISADGHYVLWYQASSFLPWSQKASRVVEVTPAGQVVRAQDLAPIEPERGVQWVNVLWALMVPIAGPVLCVAGLIAFEWVSYGRPMAADLWRDLRQEFFVSPMVFWIAVATVLVIGAVLWAVAVYAIARRYRFTRRERTWWMALGFVFGPAGLLLMLSLREWPARLACVSCGKMRMVDREHCGNCGAPWPPARCGDTEIDPHSGVGG